MFNIPNAFVTLALTKTSPVGHYLHGLTFLLLHSLQWVVSARVEYLANKRG
jgi:hypothetical protein